MTMVNIEYIQIGTIKLIMGEMKAKILKFV